MSPNRAARRFDPRSHARRALTLLLAIGFVVLVILLFLRRVTATLMPSLAIPI